MMLMEILCRYAKMPHARGTWTLWKTERKMAQIIACLFGVNGDVDLQRRMVCNK